MTRSERIEAAARDLLVTAEEWHVLVGSGGPSVLTKRRRMAALRASLALPEEGSRRYVYVAGPYTGDEEANMARALEAATHLLGAGLYPYVPHLSHYWEAQHAHHYEVWMELDFGWVRRCDAVLRLDGASSGADREVALAKRLGLPVFSTPAEVIAWAAAPPAAPRGPCNVESEVGSHCRLTRGHLGTHLDRHGNEWPATEPRPPAAPPVEEPRPAPAVDAGECPETVYDEDGSPHRVHIWGTGRAPGKGGQP